MEIPSLLAITPQAQNSQEKPKLKGKNKKD